MGWGATQLVYVTPGVGGVGKVLRSGVCVGGVALLFMMQKPRPLTDPTHQGIS